MSGHGPEILAKYGLANAGQRFVEKPLNPVMLRERVLAALGDNPHP